MRILTLFRVFTLLLCVDMIGLPSAYAQSGSLREQQLKTAYLYNFTKFVQWPDSVLKQTITLCTVGEDWLGESIEKMQGKVVQGNILNVRRAVNHDDIGDCNVLYLGSLDSHRRANIIENLPETAILTIADGENFVHQGGIISLVLKQQSKQFSQKTKIGFMINIDAVQRSGLVFSSQLLKIAEVIHE